LPRVKFADLAVGPAPQLPLEAHVARRRKLAKAIGEGNALVVATHRLQTFSHDVDYVFRPHSDFWYLTGFAEPGAILVLQGGTGHTTLFLRPRKPEAEIWAGRRLGVERARDALDVDAAHDITDLPRRLPQVLGKDRVHAIAAHDPTVRRLLRKAARTYVPDPLPARPGGPSKKPKPKRRDDHAAHLLHDMRLVKDAQELRLLKRACDLGVAAHKEAAAAIRPGAYEFQVEARFAHHARHNGSTGVGYPSICGCGPNAAVLHYISNLSRLRSGQAFLVDAGCEWGYYTSDITRTYPVGGDFGQRQARLYDLVLDAHKAALRQVRPGHPFRAPHEAAVETITAGLLDLGYLEGSLEKALKEQTYRRFFMHGTSHWLGLDVHDAGSPTDPDGKPRILREGMVLTVEPGLYFNEDFAACPPGTAGIGIRIEDDVAVTGSGSRNLTRALPVEPGDVAGLLA
jgi:Xaa-Pro aminopeptidase